MPKVTQHGSGIARAHLFSIIRQEEGEGDITSERHKDIVPCALCE